MINLPSSWLSLLGEEIQLDALTTLRDFLVEEDRTQLVYPPHSDRLKAFELVEPTQVKVVVIGQDPYHGPKQANGLAFSVNDGVKIPPSLRNIFKEITQSGAGRPGYSGNLEPWAKQGVLLLNNVLTVRAGMAGSHQKKGWEILTDAAVDRLSEKHTGLVFMLWGASAQQKGQRINREKHLVLESVHPSPLSAYRGFIGNNHFVQANTYLVNQGKKAIDWSTEMDTKKPLLFGEAF